MDSEVTMWLTAGGAVFALFAVLGAIWTLRRDRRRRREVFAQRYDGDVQRILALVGPDEAEVLRTLRRTKGPEAAAIRLRRVDKDLPFEVLVEAARTLP